RWRPHRRAVRFHRLATRLSSMSGRSFGLMLAGLLVAMMQGTALADPWLAPGDERIRSDIQLLADAGILHGPVTTWPMSWPDIARDALAIRADSTLDSSTFDALLRIQRLARAASSRGGTGRGISVSGAVEPVQLRGFAATPREEGELAMRTGWLGDKLAINLQATVVADPDDDRSLRPDGSYIGVNVGNFMVSAGYMERWWGPGWDSSLILSTNARPIPGLTLERNYSDPFKTPLLSWIGPWRASIAVGEEEEHDVAVSRVRFLAARVDFKPRPWLELALTRTAQWCGGDRTCNLGTLRDLLIGRDNRSDALGADDEPGNQMAGYDMRLRSPWRKLPAALYTQWIGEDEAGGLPSKFVGLFGVEVWGSTRFGTHRLRAEYTDTACVFTRQNPEFGCAYRNSIYPQGYTYRGRIIGSSMDNDSRMTTVAALLTRKQGDVVSLALRHVQLNRDGGAHALTPVPLDLDNVEMQYSRHFGFGRISAGLGYEDAGTIDSGSRIHGFLNWQQGF
ncbi:MAG TPA: capsule assembly Wzi family protein, partial [Vicinamibacterales bacterium]|nr:capsule assembly Wzi family protein [Vicinamibacterales bacterium]